MDGVEAIASSAKSMTRFRGDNRLIEAMSRD